MTMKQPGEILNLDIYEKVHGETGLTTKWLLSYVAKCITLILTYTETGLTLWLFIDTKLIV